MNAAFRRENVNGVYLALHAKILKDLLTCVREIPDSRDERHHALQGGDPPHLDNTDSHTNKSVPAIRLCGLRMASCTASIPTRLGSFARWSAG